MVSNLEAVVYAADGSELEIGVARDSHWYRTYGDEPLQEAQLNWRGSLATLQKIEHLRNGGPVRLMLRCCGRGHFLYGEYDGHEKRPLMSEPDPFSGQVIVTYPKEIWVAMTRRLGATANVLVEVPLSPPPPAPWDEVWAAVAEARDLLERGGDTNWVASVKAVRVALEKWQAIEKEKMGPGWKAPTPAERKERTKTERLDNVRWHLLQCAHQGAHGLADGWTRDDAVLMLSTLCALLAIRKP